MSGRRESVVIREGNCRIPPAAKMHDVQCRFRLRAEIETNLAQGLVAKRSVTRNDATLALFRAHLWREALGEVLRGDELVQVDFGNECEMFDDRPGDYLRDMFETDILIEDGDVGVIFTAGVAVPLVRFLIAVVVVTGNICRS